MVIWPNKKESNPMAYTPKPGSGQLFRNTDKQQDADRDYQGSATLPDGTEVWLSGWLKDGKRGKFLSLSFKPKQERVDRSRPLRDDLDDAIPF
jgi:hypothetical protein